MIRRALPYLLGLALVLAIAFAGYGKGYADAGARWKAINADLRSNYAEAVAQAQKATADAIQVARDTEQRRQADMAALDAKYTKELTDAKTAADRTISDLRAGAIRVRDRLTCPAAGTGAAGQAGASAGLGDAAPRGGFSAADAELVLRIGGEADEVAVQLAACQGIVKGDRE